MVAAPPVPVSPSTPPPSSRPEPPVLASGPALPSLAAFGAWLAPAGARRATPVVTPADLAAALGAPARRMALFAVEDAAERAARRLLEDLPYGASIGAAAERHRLDRLLVAAVVEVESRFTPRAVSPRGAVGLMQVLPATAARYGRADLRDPHANLDVGLPLPRLAARPLRRRPGAGARRLQRRARRRWRATAACRPSARPGAT